MAPFSSLRRVAMGFALVAVLTACSSAPAPTPRPTATPTAVPTAAPTATPTAAPTATPVPVGEFAFSFEDILAYWRDDQGFTCDAAVPSIYAGYEKTICNKDQANGLIFQVALVTDEMTGKLAAGWAGVIDPTDKDMTVAASATHLGSFVGTLLGETNGKPVGEWLGKNLGAKYEELKISANMTAATYYTWGGVDSLNEKSQFAVQINTAAYLIAPERSAAPSPSAAAAARWDWSRDEIANAFATKQDITFDTEEQTFSNGDAYVLGEDKSGDVLVAVVADSGTAMVTQILVIDDSNGAGTGEGTMGFALGLMEPASAQDAATWVQTELDKAYANKKTPIKDTMVFGSTSMTFTAWSTTKPERIGLNLTPLG